MKRIVPFAILGAAIGVVAGYFLFSEIAGARVSVQALLGLDTGSGLGGAIRRAAGEVAGLDEIRRNIIITGAVGAGIAAITAVISGVGGRRRRR